MWLECNLVSDYSEVIGLPKLKLIYYSAGVRVFQLTDIRKVIVLYLGSRAIQSYISQVHNLNTEFIFWQTQWIVAAVIY